MKKVKWIIGIDEVGRGPIAGPVTVAAIATMAKYKFQIKNYGLDGIRDSKQLTALQRQLWNKVIRKEFYYTITSMSNKTIDKHGISWSLKIAVAQVLKKLLIRNPIIHNSNALILLDGNLTAPPEYKNQHTIIKGDEKEPLIAAASVVAKVHRDRYMMRLHSKIPQYKFDQHKGYGTEMHRRAVLKYGLSDVHRKSFCKGITIIKDGA